MTHCQIWKDMPKDKWRRKNFSPRELANNGELLLHTIVVHNEQCKKLCG